MSSDKSLDPLQEYLDSLLGDGLRGDPEQDVSNRLLDETGLKLAAGGNVSTLPSASRPSRIAPARPYAEPVRTLNLRMPLPHVAPASTPVEAAPVIQVAANISAEL